jgi:hypothetical protein
MAMFISAITPRNISIAVAQVLVVFAIIILFIDRVQGIFANT